MKAVADLKIRGARFFIKIVYKNNEGLQKLTDRNSKILLQIYFTGRYFFLL